MILPFLCLAIAAGGCGQGEDSRNARQQQGGGPTAEQPAGLPPSDSLAPDSARFYRTWNEARRRGVDFRASGNEPGWYLEIFSGDSLRLVADYGERRVNAPVGPPVLTDSMRAWQAQSETYHLSIIAEPLPCTDSMSGMRHPSTVTVILDGRAYHGCGRDL